MSSKLRIGILATRTDIPPISCNPGDDIVRDGQRWLIGQALNSVDEIEWVPFCRYSPLQWLDGESPLRGVHPKWMWPLWSKYPQISKKFTSCDYLINASGPLLYAGRWFHSNYEPWHLVLNRWLRSPKSPKFLNLAFGTAFDERDLRVMQSTGWVQRATDSFTRSVADVAYVSTAREELAQSQLKKYLPNVNAVPCPSLFGANFHGVRSQKRDGVLLNFHPMGTRAREAGSKGSANWVRVFRALLKRLKAKGKRCHFIFHEENELALARKHLDLSDAHYVVPGSVKEYIQCYANAEVAVSCRVHGVYAAASCGIPAVGIGSDTRARMIDMIGYDCLSIDSIEIETLEAAVFAAIDNSTRQSEAVNAIKDNAKQYYIDLLRDSICRDRSTRSSI